MPSTFEFVIDRGGTLEKVAREMVFDMLPTQADLQDGLERQRSRILERTARGVDFEERPFAAYSTKGPYYYYPSSGRAVPKGNQAAADREHKRRQGAQKRFIKKVGGTAYGSYGVKYDSYAAFKAALGRSGVDLTGRSAPHMLQGIDVKVSSDLTVAKLGIYGDEAERASGHNDGNPSRNLPQRRFFDWSNNDIEAFYEDLDASRAKRQR